MEAIVVIILQIFFATCGSENFWKIFNDIRDKQALRFLTTN